LSSGVRPKIFSDLNGSARVVVTAFVRAHQRVDDEVEKIVGLLSREPTASVARWRPDSVPLRPIQVSKIDPEEAAAWTRCHSTVAIGPLDRHCDGCARGGGDGLLPRRSLAGRSLAISAMRAPWRRGSRNMLDGSLPPRSPWL
jgi:hypothetical protein